MKNGDAQGCSYELFGPLETTATTLPQAATHIAVAN